ncbi:hypothetical protein BUALT_Bualt10G0011700 [Buddleja alternifolia]|uniref:SWIM-type domain-containing protein n=1 Tax=Buddleja alternifolia TaxID=168488 RepID=A0AAV6X609_9LAMI|nr:hypothetical protein BUALT_Bualt10G0011700 [Buddleja alternifolia]
MTVTLMLILILRVPDKIWKLTLPSEEENAENSGDRRFIRFNPIIDMSDPKFVNGMLFTDAAKFKAAIRSHAVTWQRDIKFIKNDRIRVRARYNGKKCPWLVYASNIEDTSTFQIKTLCTTHKCGRTLSKHRFLTSRLLSSKYMNDWRLHNGWRLDDFQEKVHNDLNVEVSRAQYYRTKKKVYDMLYGKYKDQYTRLYDYCEELRVSNPGSTVVLKTCFDEKTGEERFLRLYVCFSACKKGFLEGCRPIIGVDGCHLKGPHKGIILTVVGLDPNNCIFPICYCVVETEDKSTWKWFLELLQQDLSIYEQEKWSFISDRQKGLLPALYDIFPKVEHRYCVRHMYTNFKKSHPGLALKARLWNLAKASTEAQFTLQMQSLKDVDEVAHQWISEVHPSHWSRSYFRTYPKCDILLNNLCESFNSTLLEARNKPLLNMLERIRIYIHKTLQVRREFTDKWNDAICPKIQTTLEKLKNDTRSCMARYVGGTKFEVKDMYQGQYAVDIGLRTCSCRRWDLCGIPCIHGVSAIVASDREPEEYVHRCYNKETFLKAYGFIINPVRGQAEWPKTGRGPVSPNFEFRLPGHNRVKCPTLKPIYEEENIVTEPEDPENRVSSPHILGNVHIPEIAQGPDPMPKKKRKCSVCLREGHNRAKCPTAAGRMWQNIDFYGYNGQKDLNLSNTGGVRKEVPKNSKDKSKASSSSHAVTEPVNSNGKSNASSSSRPVTEPVNVPQKSKSKEVSSNLMIAHINAKETGTSTFTIQDAIPPQPPIRDDASLSQIVCISGIPVQTKFMKSGKSCVTLSSLQAAASQRVTKQMSSL